MWRREEREPWGNVEARVNNDVAEAFNGEETLYTDYQAMADEKDED